MRQNPLIDVELIALESSASGGGLTFRATDRVTNLRHQIAWVATWSGDRLKRLVQTHMIVDPLRGKSPGGWR